MSLIDNCEEGSLQSADDIKKNLVDLLEEEGIKLSSLNEAHTREARVLSARRAELNNLLCAVQLVADLDERGMQVRHEVLSTITDSFEQMLADPEFAGAHQFTIDQHENTSAE